MYEKYHDRWREISGKTLPTTSRIPSSEFRGNRYIGTENDGIIVFAKRYNDIIRRGIFRSFAAAVLRGSPSSTALRVNITTRTALLFNLYL